MGEGLRSIIGAACNGGDSLLDFPSGRECSQEKNDYFCTVIAH